MITISNPNVLQKKIIHHLKAEGKTIGFVPTMGALHNGHLSLVKQCLKTTDITFVSIFVNPTQFEPNEDLEKYPRHIKQDKTVLKNCGTDILFLPTTNAIYPKIKNNSTNVYVPTLSSLLCGKSRPNHFQGVCTIVCKLINIVQPDKLFLGQKDFQQLVILKKMVKDLFIQVTVIGGKTVREENGLALSSRNNYLTLKEKEDASLIYQTLKLGQKLFKNGETSTEAIIIKLKKNLAKSRYIKTEYLKIVDSETLTQNKKSKLSDHIVFAGKIGTTRLIDNMAIK